MPRGGAKSFSEHGSPIKQEVVRCHDIDIKMGGGGATQSK